MSGFQLDTSGDVGPMPAGPMNERFLTWPDLSPFAQGYIEAAFQALIAGKSSAWAVSALRYDRLAPETLARIIADCERLRHVFGWLAPSGAVAKEPPPWFQEEGRSAWKYRQNGDLPNFPPLTVRLGDDGKVRFAEAAITRADGGGA